MPEPSELLLSHIELVLDAARGAPSHNNMQPWRFVVDGETVSFLEDHERDRSPGNAGGRMARIAVGAALECALVSAGRMGSTVRFLPPHSNALVTISVSSPKRIAEPDKALVRRCTNRRLYDGRPVDDATFAWLQQATPPLDATRTLWFGRERVRTVGPIVGEGEALFFTDPRVRETALRAMRFDVRDNEEVTQGVSLGCLELSGSERLALDALRRGTPQDRLMGMGVFERMGAHARKLVESASGLCVVVTRGSEPAADLAVGRNMQRAWLALTRRGLVAQPMNSIPSLETILEADEQAGSASAGAERAAAVVAAARTAIPSVEKGARIALLMRFGFAPPPTSLVRRLPLADSVAFGGPVSEP
jgi:nitroreductase